MINVHTKLELYMKGTTKCWNWGNLGLGVTQCHRQCRHLMECIRLPIRL